MAKTIRVLTAAMTCAIGTFPGRAASLLWMLDRSPDFYRATGEAHRYSSLLRQGGWLFCFLIAGSFVRFFLQRKEAKHS